MDDFREGLPELGPKWLDWASIGLAVFFAGCLGWVAAGWIL